MQRSRIPMVGGRWQDATASNLLAGSLPRIATRLLVALFAAPFLAGPQHAQSGFVYRQQKISATAGGFEDELQERGEFGYAATSLGDLDGDGVSDLAIGAWTAAPGGEVWIVFLERDGTVKESRCIMGDDLSGPLIPNNAFGGSVAALGDVDGDGVTDLAVGAPYDPDGTNGEPGDEAYGAVWVLFLRADGTVKASQKISKLQGGFSGGIQAIDYFGYGVAGMGDLDGDGVPDMAVGAPFNAAGNRGALWILRLNADGTVKSQKKIADGVGGFPAGALGHDAFGWELASLGDLNGDGYTDLAVGAPLTGGLGIQRGAVWILFLDGDQEVVEAVKIDEETPGGPQLEDRGLMGYTVSVAGDVDGDGTTDLAVGIPYYADRKGALAILFLRPDGTLRGIQEISDEEGGLKGETEPGDVFGIAAACIGDLDGDGIPDLVVGASGDDDGGTNRGAFFVLFLDGVVRLAFETEDDFVTPLANGTAITSDQRFGRLVDVDGFPRRGPTAAVFDSSPTGPNQLGQDPDLLVGKGNVLVLQESFELATQGVYAVPGDDELGGDFRVTFLGETVRPQTIDLVDIDQAPFQDAWVRLTDQAGRTRTYVVPAGWTEDLVLDGGPGFRTLDLTTIDDQPGFVATATASEKAGFDAGAVVLLEVHLDGSGAIDDLRFDPHPDVERRRDRARAPSPAVR